MPRPEEQVENDVHEPPATSIVPCRGLDGQSHCDGVSTVSAQCSPHQDPLLANRLCCSFPQDPYPSSALACSSHVACS